jgi:CBS domain-containing protein
MVMLTEVLRFQIEDEKGRRARVSDLSIALLDDDYPPVTKVFFEIEGKEKQLPWDQVRSLDLVSGKITVSDFDRATLADDSSDVRLRRDIFDSLVLDLLGRRTTRVCDLLLERDNGNLRLKGADAGLKAMFRRVLKGRWLKTPRRDLFDWKYVEYLRGDPAAVNSGAGYRMRINRLPAGEIARLADYVPYLHAAELLKLLPDEKAANVLEAMPIDRQVQVFEELDESQATSLLCRMSPDLATDLIGRLEIAVMRRYLDLMPVKHRNLIVELLRYPEDSVGGVMMNDIIFFRSGLSCRDAKAKVQQMLEDAAFSGVVFVVDDDKGRLLRGSVNLRELLAADNARTLKEIMDPYLQTLTPFDDANNAAYRIVVGQLPAMPVTNNRGELIGAMTVEAAIARLLPSNANFQRLRVFS